MPFSLKGHTAIVTGSSTGLGKAIAVALGDAGAQVAFNYQRNRSRAEATFAAYEATGAKGLLVRGDVTDPDEVNRMQREIAEKLGPVDILVPNATPDQPQRPIEEYDWAFYQTMLDYFVKSPFLLARACLPEMKRRKWGRIVNIGSEAFQRGVGNFSAYVAAKGGQTGWTRSLATELAPFGITVNLVAPGWIPVERHENDPPEMKAAYLGAIPAKRWGTPADVAAAVVYLASDGAAFVTGQTLAVNGGLTVS
jgi:3-oxoacyl-[acyl-carrier protein] reductase